jgi:subtilase family serine protease
VSRFFLCLAGAFILFAYISPCLATYNFEGTPDQDEFIEITSGTVKGGLYVDGGEGLKKTPYVQEFNVPGDTVAWARVYVGVWGGSEVKTGTLDLTINGEEFESLNLEGKSDRGDDEGQNPSIYCAGHGVYWIAYDPGTNISTGPVTVEAQTQGDIDGRVYGIILAAVYEDREGQNTRYWVEEGNINLHSKGWSEDMAATHDEAYADFSGKVDVDKYSNANLAVVYICGSPGLDDSLYFNDEQLSDGENKNDIANSKSYFDFKFFDVLDLLAEDDNELRFQRDDEDYVHPVLATLSLGTGEEGNPDLIVSGLTVPLLYAGKDNTIKASIKNIGKDSAYGLSAALYADGDIVSTAPVSSLSGGKSKTIEFNWKPSRDGKQALKVYVDYTNKKKELCEVNNWNTPFLAEIVDLTPPELEIDTPEDGSLVDTGYLTVSGTVDDTSQNLTVDVNGQPALLSGESWSASVPVVSGPNTIVVCAVDGKNNTGREFIVVEGKASSLSDFKQYSGSDNDTEPVTRGFANSGIEANEKQPVFSPVYGEIGFISAVLLIRFRNRGKRL